MTGIFRLIWVGLFLAACTPSFATRFYRAVPKSTVEGEAALPWEKIELHRDYHPRFPLTRFHPKLTQFYPQTKDAFGSEKPPSRDFLLYMAPGWDRGEGVPVLLIHGANDDATRRFARPESTLSKDHLAVPGLMQFLSNKGFRVFAISFSHYHGDNLYQGEHIANAIKRIRKLLGQGSNQGFQVDLLSFSKGLMAARCYLQSAGQYYHKKHLTAYRGDVRRFVSIGGPIVGIDLPYRYYLYNLNIHSQKIPAPLGAAKLRIGPFMQKTEKNHILSGLWPGQLQMIHDLRLLGIPYGPLSLTADANLSGRVLRDGGKTLFLESKGLDQARKAGGNLVEVLNNRGLPPGVEAILIAGTLPILFDETHPGWSFPAGAQIIAKNDGLVFLRSALYEEGLTARGARVIAKKSFLLNHLGLSRHAKVFQFVAEKLTN